MYFAQHHAACLLLPAVSAGPKLQQKHERDQEEHQDIAFTERLWQASVVTKGDLRGEP